MKRILVTRPEAQNQALIAAIESQGYQAVALPLLTIEAFTGESPEVTAIKQQALQLDNYQKVIFASTNAVKYGCDWFEQYWPQWPVQQQWFGIGNATTKALQAFKACALDNDVAMTSESLLAMAQFQKVTHEKILICRGLGGRHFLREQLQARGAVVEYCSLYQRLNVSYQKQELVELLDQGLDAILTSSGETIQQLWEQAMIDAVEKKIRDIPVVVPSPRVQTIAKQLGFTRAIVAENASDKAMLEAVDKQ